MIRRNFSAIRLILFMLSVSIPMVGQNQFQSEWAVGASSGVNFSSVSFVPKVYQNQLMGYQGGITVRWNTEKNLGLQAELNFKQQGWKENFDKTDKSPNDFKYIRRMNCLELPIFTHIYFGGENVKFFINLGPQIGYIIGENIDSQLTGRKPENEEKSNQHNIPLEKKFEWGLGGGPGVEIRSKVGFFLLEGRYYYAFSDFYNTRKGDAFSKASSQVISAKLTYLIPLRNK